MTPDFHFMTGNLATLPSISQSLMLGYGAVFLLNMTVATFMFKFIREQKNNDISICYNQANALKIDYKMFATVSFCLFVN